MAECIVQRCCIKFCVKLVGTQSETIKKLKKFYGTEAVGATQIREWNHHFKTHEDSGRPTNINPETIEEIGG